MNKSSDNKSALLEAVEAQVNKLEKDLSCERSESSLCYPLFGTEETYNEFIKDSRIPYVLKALMEVSNIEVKVTNRSNGYFLKITWSIRSKPEWATRKFLAGVMTALTPGIRVEVPKSSQKIHVIIHQGVHKNPAAADIAEVIVDAINDMRRIAVSEPKKQSKNTLRKTT